MSRTLISLDDCSFLVSSVCGISFKHTATGVGTMIVYFKNNQYLKVENMFTYEFKKVQKQYEDGIKDDEGRRSCQV